MFHDLIGAVPEFHYDLIARIVPGLLVIIAIFPPWHEKVQSLSIMDGMLALGLAYFIGITIDLIIDPITIPFMNFTGLAIDGDIRNYCNNPTEDQLSHATKLIAEKVLFRSCAAITLIFFFIRPTIFGDIDNIVVLRQTIFKYIDISVYNITLGIMLLIFCFNYVNSAIRASNFIKYEHCGAMVSSYNAPKYPFFWKWRMCNGEDCGFLPHTAGYYFIEKAY